MVSAPRGDYILIAAVVPQTQMSLCSFPVVKN